MRSEWYTRANYIDIRVKREETEFEHFADVWDTFWQISVKLEFFTLMGTTANYFKMFLKVFKSLRMIVRAISEQLFFQHCIQWWQDMWNCKWVFMKKSMWNFIWWVEQTFWMFYQNWTRYICLKKFRPQFRSYLICVFFCKWDNPLQSVDLLIVCRGRWFNGNTYIMISIKCKTWRDWTW